MRRSRVPWRAILPSVSLLLILTAHANASPYNVSIIDRDVWVSQGNAESDIYVLPDEMTTICIWIDPDHNGDGYAGGFEFLIGYDWSVMALLDVHRGSDLHADWEYFTYRLGITADSCAACPGALVRMLGIADMNNGITPPGDAFALSGCVAEVTFDVTSNWNYVNTVHPIPFCSFNCRDNVISSVAGDSLFLPAGGYVAGDAYDPGSCASGGPEAITQNITCQSGTLVIYEPVSPIGDLNLDGISHTIADAVLFSRFLTYGKIVFDTIFFDDQVAASDMNCDSLTASLEDLAFLLNVIRGDLDPCLYSTAFPPSAGPDPPYSEDDTIRVVRVAAEAGDAITIDLYMRNTDPIGAFDFRLLYDPAVLEPIVSADTLFRNGDTALTIATPTFLRSGNFDVYAGGISEPGVLQFAAADFQGTPGTQLAPGAGVTLSTQWRVLPSATPQISPLVFAVDPAYPYAHNAFVDPHATNWKRPVMMSGHVNIGGALCNCPSQGDLEQDGFITAVDLGLLIDVLYAGRTDTVSPDCPAPGSDFDCDLVTTALDLGKMIDHLFGGADGPCDPCSP